MVTDIKFDLHCHSTASDGSLPPADVVALAAQANVQLLSLTDHDTLAGQVEARAAAEKLGIEFLSGIELSVTWEKHELHMVALGFDPEHDAILSLVDAQLCARETRAKAMGKKLDKAAVMVGAYDKAAALSGQSAPGRPWFAKVLLEENKVRSMDHAFNRFLKQGQSAFVRTPWVSLQDAIDVITQAGGVCVIAHPTRYGLTRTKLRALLKDFQSWGGQGLEVATPGLHVNQRKLLEECLVDFDLYASGGSDFHTPAQSWLTLGSVPPLPTSARPIWQALI